MNVERHAVPRDVLVSAKLGFASGYHFLTQISQMIIKTKITQINYAIWKLLQAEINLCNSVKISFHQMPKKNSA